MIRAKQQRRTPSLLSFVCDVSDAAAVANMAAQVRAAVAPRHVSVLVNNAGNVVEGGVLWWKPPRYSHQAQAAACMHRYSVWQADSGPAASRCAADHVSQLPCTLLDNTVCRVQRVCGAHTQL